MSSASSLPYKLRPNKAVDRELFLALLGRLAATLKIESYRYLSLGGAFLEDFRLIHARLGITDMVCVESEHEVHLRQIFNRPIDSIVCVYSTLENYIDTNEFEKPVIIWFDYTDPGKIGEQIERFARTITVVPINSVLRITLNASPTSLGTPSEKQNLQEWRLDRFRERVGSLVPSDLKPEGMFTRNYGNSVLQTLYIAVEKEVLSMPDRNVVWALSTYYADGQPMVTATLLVQDVHKEHLKTIIHEWPFNSTPITPKKIDMPTLSTKERLTMESSSTAKKIMGYDLPKSEIGEDPFEMFRQYYRVYPHFARIDL